MKESMNPTGKPIDKVSNKVNDGEKNRGKNSRAIAPFGTVSELNRETKKNINSLFQQVNEEIDSILEFARSHAPLNELLTAEEKSGGKIGDKSLNKMGSSLMGSQSVIPLHYQLLGYKCNVGDCHCPFCTAKKLSPQLISSAYSMWEQGNDEINTPASVSSRMFANLDGDKYCPLCSHELVMNNKTKLIYSGYDEPKPVLDRYLKPTSLLQSRQITVAISNPYADYDDFSSTPADNMKKFAPDSIVGMLTKEINLGESVSSDVAVQTLSSANAPSQTAQALPTSPSPSTTPVSIPVVSAVSADASTVPAPAPTPSVTSVSQTPVATSPTPTMPVTENVTDKIINNVSTTSAGEDKVTEFLERLEAVEKASVVPATYKATSTSLPKHDKIINSINDATFPTSSLDFTKESIFRTQATETEKVEPSHKLEDFFPDEERISSPSVASTAVINPISSNEVVPVQPSSTVETTEVLSAVKSPHVKTATVPAEVIQKPTVAANTVHYTPLTISTLAHSVSPFTPVQPNKPIVKPAPLHSFSPFPPVQPVESIVKPTPVHFVPSFTPPHPVEPIVKPAPLHSVPSSPPVQPVEPIVKPTPVHFVPSSPSVQPVEPIVKPTPVHFVPSFTPPHPVEPVVKSTSTYSATPFKPVQSVTPASVVNPIATARTVEVEPKVVSHEIKKTTEEAKVSSKSGVVEFSANAPEPMTKVAVEKTPVGTERSTETETPTYEEQVVEKEPAWEEIAEETPAQEEETAKEEAPVEEERPAEEEVAEEASVQEEAPAEEEVAEETPAQEEEIVEEVPAEEETAEEVSAQEEAPAEEEEVEEAPAEEEVAEETPAQEEETAEEESESKKPLGEDIDFDKQFAFDENQEMNAIKQEGKKKKKWWKWAK